MIEADGELLGDLATKLRNRIYEDFADSVFDPAGKNSGKMEVNALKRGPKDVSFCKMQLNPGSQPRVCSPIRAVGIKEREMKKKIKGFLDKGWIVRSHSASVARGFLVKTRNHQMQIGHQLPVPELVS